MLFDFDELDAVDPPPPPGPDEPSVQRLWAISDPHTDVKENFDFLRRLDSEAHVNDAIIVAGDISDSLEVIRQTLQCLKAKFRWVFFVPGNHELWVRAKERGQMDSMSKLTRLQKLCAQEGIETRPRRLRCAGTGTGLWIVPLLSWHCPSFDTEPEIDERWQDIPVAESVCSDYVLCSWPAPFRQQDSTVAARLDAVNDELSPDLKPLQRQEIELLFAGHRRPSDVVASFSHFLPRLDLLPEKRYLFFPCLAKFVGSPFLGERVARLAPDVHVFGHTHFGWDQELSGIRYISPPIGMPRERSERLATISTGNFLEAMQEHEQTPRPVLIWDHCAGLPPQYEAGWSGFYSEYKREPQEVLVLPEYVASLYKWDEKKWGPKAQVTGWQGRKPAWFFGPAFCLDRFRRAQQRTAVLASQ